MTGYMGKCKQLGGRIVYRLFLLVLLAPNHAQAQTELPSPTDRPRRAEEKTRKRHVPERTFGLVGAADIASCKSLEAAKATAKLIEQMPGTVCAAGDLAYERGSAENFKNCYDPTWGRFKDRTKPALGNHEYANRTASGYFQYWGAQAGAPGQGYYNYRQGERAIFVLEKKCSAKC